MPAKPILFLLLLLALLSACAGTPAAPTAAASQLDAEQTAVYAALVQTEFPADMLVIMDTTATDASSTPLDTTLGYVLKNLGAVDPGTVASFRARNAAPGAFPAGLSLGVPYQLLSQARLNALFTLNADGWQMFYDQFPHAPGILTLSAVGFDVAFDQALVYAGIQSQALDGSGTYYLLVKTNGAWTVSQRVQVWTS